MKVSLVKIKHWQLVFPMTNAAGYCAGQTCSQQENVWNVQASGGVKMEDTGGKTGKHINSTYQHG